MLWEREIDAKLLREAPASIFSTPSPRTARPMTYAEAAIATPPADVAWIKFSHAYDLAKNLPEEVP